jgi:hypothetical protein
MKWLNILKWMLTGYPMYFAGISAGTAAAIAASAAASIGGAAISASSSKKAAKTGAQGAANAAAIDWEKIQIALDNAGIRLNEDQMQNLAANLQSRQDLQPYAATGRNSLNALSIGMGMGDPQAKQHGTQAKQQAQRDYQKIIQQARQKGQQAIRDFVKSPGYSTMTPQQRTAAMKQIRLENTKALQTVQAGKTKYINDAYTKSQQLPANAGDLSRNFSKQDYINDPTSGGNAPPDLTKNFGQDEFLALGGHTQGDLTRDFDMNAYLASQGRAPDALTRDFQRSDFEADPGYQFRIEEGNKGIEGSAAARGSVLSGAAMKALARFNQDTASNEYGKVFDRYGQNRANLQNVAYNAQNQFGLNRQALNQNLNSAFDRFNVNRSNAANVYNQAYDRFNNNNTNQFNRLSSMASAGQNAATNQAGFTQNMAGRNSAALQNNAQLVAGLMNSSGQRQGDYLTQQANANMAGQVGSANAWGSGMNQVGNSLMQGAYLYGQNKKPEEPPNYNQYGVRTGGSWGF